MILILISFFYQTSVFASPRTPIPTSLVNDTKKAKTPTFTDINQSMVNYAKKSGLSQITVLAIAQDQLGFLWFGTQGGLNRFDGYEFKHFSAEPLKKDRLAGNFITSLCDDGSHNLWIGTTAGLSVYNYKQGVFSSFLSHYDNRIPSDYITSLRCEKEKIWVGTEGTGFYSLNFADNKITNFTQSSGLKVLGITTLSSDVYLATMQGVYVYNTINESLIQHSEHSTKSLTILENELYVGRHDGWLDSYDLLNNAFEKKLHLQVSPITNNAINALVTFNENVWMSTNNGLYLINSTGKILDKHLHHPLITESLADDMVLSILVDKNKNLWIGSDSSGINYLSQTVKELGHVNKYSYPDAPLVEDEIRGFALDAQNRLWFATTRGAYIFEHERFYSIEILYPDLAFLENVFITDIIFKGDNAWLATLGFGVVKLNLKSKHVTLFSPQQNNSPTLRLNAIVIYKDKILFSSRDHGVLYFDQQKNILAPYFMADKKAPQSVTGIIVNGDDLWFGSNGNGVFRLHQGTLENLTKTDGLLSNLSFSLELDSKQRVWAASDAGVNIISRNFEVEHTLNKGNGLIGNAVWAMVFDKQGSMWLGTSDGLSQVNINDFSVRNYNESDGIQDFEYNFGAAWLSPEGRVFIGGTNGFNQFHPKLLHEKPSMPPLYLTEIIILGKRLKNSSHVFSTQPEYINQITLSHEQNIVSFKYSSLAYSHQYLDYFYRIVGFSDRWLPLDNVSRRVELIKLPPGEYQLETYAQNRQGEKSQLHKLTITLNAPWWWSNVSKVIYLLLTLTCIFFIGYLRHLNYQRVVYANVKLNRLQQRLQYSLWASGDELWDWDVKNNEIHRHSVIKRINYGLEKSQVINDHVGGFVHPDDRKAYIYALNQCLTPQQENFEIAVRVKDLNNKWCWVLDKGKVIQRDSQGNALRIAGAFKDIEALKQHEESLKQLNEDLEIKVAERTIEINSKNEKLELTLSQLTQTQNSLIESEKMAALGGLVAGVAHEINTPLGISITAISHNQDSLITIDEKLRNKTLRQSELKKSIKTQHEGYLLIINNLERASHLISNFKQIAVDQSSETKREIGITEHIEEIAFSITPLLKTKVAFNKNISITVNGPKKLFLLTYPSALYQIFSNLIENSIIHGFEDRDTGSIHIDIIDQEGNVIIHYFDDGKGIKEEMLEHVFEPFVTSKRNEGGSGLGMHIVYNLVAQLFKGNISCQLSSSGGVEVVINLPKNI